MKCTIRCKWPKLCDTESPLVMGSKSLYLVRKHTVRYPVGVLWHILVYWNDITQRHCFFLSNNMNWFCQTSIARLPLWYGTTRSCFWESGFFMSANYPGTGFVKNICQAMISSTCMFISVQVKELHLYLQEVLRFCRQWHPIFLSELTISSIEWPVSLKVWYFKLMNRYMAKTFGPNARSKGLTWLGLVLTSSWWDM